MEASATIQLHRRPNVVQPLWIYTIEIDGSTVARLAVSGREAVEVTSGRHRVQAKALWWSSRVLEVDVEPGATLAVEIAPDVRHLWNMLLRPGRFLHVEAARAA